MMAVFALSLMILGACAARPEATPAAPPPGQTAAPGATKQAWEQDWERTLAEARKEGKIVVYTGYGAEWREALSAAMSRKYGITVEAMTGRSAEIAERVMREQKNRVFQADAIIVGSSQFLLTFQPGGVLQPMDKTLVLPEVIDPKAWWQGQLPWLDRDKTYFQFYDYVVPSLVTNSDMVKPGEIKSWKDLLNPKWKGQIVINDPTTSGSGQKLMTVFAYGIMDWDYVSALAKHEPVLQRDTRLMVEWIARGKYPMVLAPHTETAFEFAKAGAPLAFNNPAEGTYLTAGFGFVGQPKGSPQPNAGKVFINFLLSKEGQTLSSKATGHHSARADTPTDFLDQILVRQPGSKYISASDSKFTEQEIELKNRVVEIFKPLLK